MLTLLTTNVWHQNGLQQCHVSRVDRLRVHRCAVGLHGTGHDSIWSPPRAENEALRISTDNHVYGKHHDRCNKRTCESLYDLSSAAIATPVLNDTLDDMLDDMRACGLNPRLLSRAVSRPGDNSTLYVVPNVVHYVLYGVPKGVRFDFQHYLSFLSASQFLKPQYIFLHGDFIPAGEWWKRTVAEVDNRYHVYRKKQSSIHGKKVNYVEHLADFTRLQICIGEAYPLHASLIKLPPD